jgi:hypothetical protein
MKNFWLDRRPKIVQMLDIYNPDVYQKWYICKPNPDANPYIGFSSQSLFLHKDGIWRTTTWVSETSQYSGYFDTWEEAYNCLMRKN